MKVMGHRGAAGLALENTIDSFEIAKIIGVDAIELDVHVTKDDKLVVIHDSNLSRVASVNRNVKSLSYRELKKIKLVDGKSYVPKLEEVLSVTDNLPLFIEIKSEGCEKLLDHIIRNNKNRDISVVSFKHSELKKLRKLNKDIKLYATEHTNPVEIIQFARSNAMNGIGLNHWLLNPLTYFLARRSKLDIFVYTVNSKLIVNIIKLLYPQVIICTDHPEKFITNRALPEQ